MFFLVSNLMHEVHLVARTLWGTFPTLGYAIYEQRSQSYILSIRFACAAGSEHSIHPLTPYNVYMTYVLAPKVRLALGRLFLLRIRRCLELMGWKEVE